MRNRKLLAGLVVALLGWGTDQGLPQTGPNPAINYSKPNFTYSPPLRKFVDSLPGLPGVTPGATNNLGQYIPVAVPDANKFPGSDYYEIALVEYREQMHSDLPPVVIPPGSALGKMDPAATGGAKLRGYVQELNGVPLSQPHYLGPLILAQSGRPTRIKFTNRLPIGAAGNLFIPTDVTYMGAGMGPDGTNSYTQNRATLHLHGGVNPWISDGTPHQWITPAGEQTPYTNGASAHPVPDMPLPAGGSMTFYWPNQNSARLMFYHDHAYGITRLNVYGGEAAGYLIVDRPGTGEWTLPIPALADNIPMVIQDKSFVPDIATLNATDPLWDTNKWGGPGNLWLPHVYMPNQDPADATGANPLGRWDYGPWFWPPWPVPSGSFPPTVSGVPESFLDTPIVNGTAYPYVNVQAKPYRLRILNACNDRMLNLQMYQAEPLHISVLAGGSNYSIMPAISIAAPHSGGAAAQAIAVVEGGVITSITVTNAGSGYTNRENPAVTIIDATGAGAAAFASALTEVTMVPAVKNPAIPFPPVWLQGTPGMIPDILDNRPGGVPHPAMRGPAMIQIGTEGGLLPGPTVIPNTPVGYEQNKRNIVVLNVSEKTLFMGPAERADIIVDFTPFAGKTIILYNDAPAPVPAGDPRNDFYTDDYDFSITGGIFYQGGAASTVAGYGPNTRTVMQFRVAGIDAGVPGPVDYYNTNMLTALQTALPAAFKATQPVPVIPQAAYNAVGYAYNGVVGGVATNTYSDIQSTNLTFIPYGTTLPVTLSLLPKCIQELFDPIGRMNGQLGVELPFTTAFIQTTIPYGYIDPVTEIFNNGETQLWKITHNGVDTHAVHFHLVNVQVINRVGWDGAIRPPEANEVGWKDTVRMNPLEDIVVATRANAPTNLPFASPDSVRLLDVTQPPGSAMGFAGVDPITGNPVTVTNGLFDFGWEYVWHCHLLGHEENDMMRPLVLRMPLAIVTTNLAVGAVGIPYSQALAATGGITPYTWRILSGALPGGLTLSSAGVISGAPTGVGVFNFTAQVQDAAGATVSQALSINVIVPPAIATTALPNGVINVVYNQALAATGGLLPYSWSVSAGALPNGLTMSAAGIISGTPTNLGTFNFTVQVSDANAMSTTKALSITVTATPAIGLVQRVSATTTGARTLSAALPSAVTASNLIVVSVAGWPNLPAAPAVTDNMGNTYSIAGTLRTASGGTWSGIYYAANAKAGVTTVTFHAVSGSPQISMVVAEFSNVAAVAPLDRAAGAVGTGTAPSSGSMAPTVAGDLVIGSGEHEGTTVTRAGTGFTMVLVATEDSNTHVPLAMEYQVLSGTTATSATFSLTAGFPWSMNGALFKSKPVVQPIPLTVSTTNLPGGNVGVLYSQTLAASGGTLPYTWTVSAGALPGGLTLSAAGVISGTPTAAGTFNFTARVQDANAAAATNNLTLVVSATQSIALVQKVAATTTGAATLVGALPSAVTVSNLIVVSVSGWPNLPAATAVTDNLGNTYNIAGTLRTSSGGAWSGIYYAANAKAGATTVTFHAVSGSPQISMVVAEFSNVAAVAPLDRAAGAVGTGTAPSSGSMAPTVAGDLVIGSGEHEGNTVTSPGSGFTLGLVATEDNNTHVPLAMEYQILSGTAATSATFSLTAGFPWSMNGALFKHK